MKISEKAFQANVIELATMLGWMVHAERPAWSNKGYRTPIQGNAGFPDLVLSHNEKHLTLFVELKSAEGELSEAQIAWLECLGQSQQVYIWRPADWDEIVEVLRGEKLNGQD